MMIKVLQDGTRFDVCLMTADLALDLAVRFDDYSEAMDFAELWSDWMGCDGSEGVAPAARTTAA